MQRADSSIDIAIKRPLELLPMYWGYSRCIGVTPDVALSIDAQKRSGPEVAQSLEVLADSVKLITA